MSKEEFLIQFIMTEEELIEVYTTHYSTGSYRKFLNVKLILNKDISKTRDEIVISKSSICID